ncbi:hypothetical protein KY289_018883 [Solanum tuberosum]|nr:hypothetical protein KY289_018883 [Solanum tuberosum]
MVHLPVHLATEAEIAGPIHYRWMYPIERWLYFLKSLIGNRACPEGCIAEGYIANECMILYSSHPGKTLGAKDPCELEVDELEQAHLYILKNCDEVLPYLKYGREFAQTHENVRHLSNAEWSRQFIDWFKDMVAQLHKGDFMVLSLMDINFMYKIMIKRVKKEEYDFVSVNPYRFLKTNEPFVLVDQASQVFYADDNSNKGWKVLRKTQPRDSYEIVEQMDDDIVELGSSSQRKGKELMRFKMKPLKIEHEVDSNMRLSDIHLSRLVLVERDEVEGLNLWVRKEIYHLRENIFSIFLYSVFYLGGEGSIGKERAQGLKNSTVSTSQGIQIMHKNLMAFEKENIQINTSSPTFTNQVKKYTHEVETMGPSAIGKGLEKRTGSLSSSIGIFEYEVGSFNKSAIFANDTPTKCTKSSFTMSCSQEKQKMKKLVLEKEDMQTNVSLPSSIDQVMKHSQTTEKCSSNPTKHKFESAYMNDHRDHMLGWMNDLWNKWREHLHAKYVKDKPIQQSLKNVPGE